MRYVPSPDLSRRRLLATGGALGVGALLAGCGGGDGGADAGNGSGAWSFTDDRGEKVTADARPKNIVAFVGTAAVLHDYGVECKGVFGPTRTKSGEPDVQAGDIDIDKVTIIGNAFGEFDIEKYASLKPDLLVSPMYEKDTLWYVPDDAKDQILDLAPSVGIQVNDVPLPKPLERHAELAKALGADLGATKVTRAKERFEKAADTLRETAKRKRGITVMAASGSPDLFYVSTPERSADLSYFAELGVEFVVPDNLDPDGFFESLSWENADKYHADLILLDNRSSALQPKDLRSKPTWTELPAVRADQVVTWVTEPRFSYEGCAPILEDLADAIDSADSTD